MSKYQQKLLLHIISSLILLIFISIIPAFFFWNDPAEGMKTSVRMPVHPEGLGSDDIDLTHPYSEPILDSDERTMEFTIKAGDTLYTLLRAQDVSPQEILAIYKNAKRLYNLKRLQPGMVMKAVFKGNLLKRIEYPVGESRLLIVERDVAIYEGMDLYGDFNASIEEIPFEERLVFYSGVIESSLYEDAIRSGIDPEIIMDLADIFAWDVDFNVDMRKGDSFKLLYKESLYRGKVVKKGPIVAAEIVNQGKRFRAFYYKDPSGHKDYYDDNGNSLRKQFLKAPLHYRRISSYFSRHRYHPILKRYRPHHGIDYAAPFGTPVVSTGDGKVIFAGRKKGYGRFIVIRHNSRYSTAYGHLSRVKRGIRRGRYVKQGEVIGYVGSSGLSTGPHLHYEFRVRGRPVNPLRYRFPSARPVNKRYIEDFKRDRDYLLSLLEGREGIRMAVIDDYKMAN